MRITSIILRALTLICVGGGFVLWTMARDNIKKKIGGKPNIDFVDTILGNKKEGHISIFDEQTAIAYEVLQSDNKHDENFKALKGQNDAYIKQLADAHPFIVLNDKDLVDIAKNDLKLRFPDIDEDKDKNGLADMMESLPDKIRSMPLVDIYDKKEITTIMDAESEITKAEKVLRDDDYKSMVVTRSKEFTGKTPAEAIIDRKNPFGDDSIQTFENKLKTAFGKLYWERNKLLSQFGKLRQHTLNRDEELQQVQKRYIAKNIESLNFEKQSGYWNGELKHTQSEFTLAKQDWTKKMDSKVQELDIANTNYKNSEKQRRESDENWQQTIDDTKANYENRLQDKERETIAAEQRGYERGRAEATKEFKGELAGTEEKPKNFFEETPLVPDPAPTPVPADPNIVPSINEPDNGTMAPGLQGQQYVGIVTNIARISASDGIIILPIGSGEGLTSGSMFTLVKEGRKTARIKVTQITPTYCIANILPQFGDPRRLRPGDQIQVIR